MLHLKSNVPAQGQRTRIEDLAVVGDELSEEQLRGVFGGLITVKTGTPTYGKSVVYGYDVVFD
jgi:hypothetical protein